ncbi:hypothetical protein [Marivirga harenae]|uniref:hypothetical protein n=1 Tax=Marivirga harenae TaxID=2010992 RepID=UPI0026DEC849|nr:hypothetical protein [Marivirga harenae]WKV10792.1 hypothetical protein Q3Y49_11270 [Marivirga harenae]
MNKFLIVILLLGFSSSICFAQNDSIDADSRPKNTSLTLSYLSLSSSFENYNSIDIGLMKTLSENRAIGGEIGYIYNIEGLKQQNEQSWYTDVYGIKAYFYYRFFLDLKESYPQNSLTFLDIEPQFYWTSFKSERIAGYSCNDQFGDCEYYRFYDSRVDRIVPGLNLKLGKIYNYDPFYFTLFVGVGYRYVLEYSEINKSLAKPDKFFTKNGQMSDLQTGGMIRLRLGLQLAYRL